jgi:hypothetical protein
MSEYAIASKRSGKNTGPGRLRRTAISSAAGRMKTSATRQSLTFVQKAVAVSRNESRYRPQSKK